MAHHIEGFIFNNKITARRFEIFKHAKLISLNQGFMFVPLTDELFDEIGSDSIEPYDSFWKFSGKIEEIIKVHSRESLIMYLETDYHGGTGEQMCGVWGNGVLLLKPMTTKFGGISEGLRLMNASKNNKRDEFEAIGLSKCRSNANCIELQN